MNPHGLYSVYENREGRFVVCYGPMKRSSDEESFTNEGDARDFVLCLLERLEGITLNHEDVIVHRFQTIPIE